MKIRISSTEAARNFGDCLSRIKYTGDIYILMKNKLPVAELVPLAEAAAGTLGEMLDALRSSHADDGFADDLERVNRTDVPMENSWP